jgi:hypothetical protein
MQLKEDPMQIVIEIIGREILHMAGALFIQRIAYHALRFLQRRLRGDEKLAWLTPSDKPVILLSGLLPFLIAIWREPWDVKVGGLVVKSWVDGAFWLAFGLFAAYDVYRIKYKD